MIRMLTMAARPRRAAALIAAAALAAGLVSAGSPPASAAEPTGLVVLDPDDNLAHASWDGVEVSELPITYAIAVAAQAKLQAMCDVAVVISRDDSANTVSRADRAAQMADADVSLTISLNGLLGSPWGTTADGGASAWASGYENNLAFAQRTLDAWSMFTGRPAEAGVNEGGSNGTTYPYAEFADLPGAYAQTFFGYLDHNFDWPAIGGAYDGMQHGYLVAAVVTAVGLQLQAQGIACGDASLGQVEFPAAPSQAELDALFMLGLANYMRYGSDPVNFATGNFLQSADLFAVAGPGGVSTPVSLTYNSLDSRDGMFGIGWSSQLTLRSQTYADGSVLVTGDEGSAVAYTLNGNGTYSAARPGIYSVLSRTGEHELRLSLPDASAQTFAEDAISGAGAMTSRTDRAGHEWSYAYEATSTTIPGVPSGWPVAPDGSTAGASTPDVVVAGLGALTSITEPGGQAIVFGSDAAGRITAVTRPDGATWALTYTGAGELASISDPLGRVTSYAYDESHRMLSVTAPGGVRYVSNTYDAQGRVVAQVNGDGAASTIAYGADGTTTYTDTTGAQTTFAMDAQGRVTKVTTPLGHEIGTGYADWDATSSTDANGHATSSAYDGNGNLVSRTDPTGATATWTYTASGDLTAATDALGRTTAYTVDAQGRTTAIAGPDGAQWAQSFDQAGNLTSRTDPNGNVTSFAYDGHGNLVTAIDAAGGVTSLAYDAADRLVSVTDPLGRATSYGYDAADELVSATLPSGAATTYTYTAAGKVASITDPLGRTTGYTYTAGLNVASATLPDGGVWSYGYDSEGRRTSVTDPDGGVTSYAYDAEGLLIAETDPTGGITRRAYDAGQNLVSITDPNGATTAIGYDAADRPVSVTDPLGGVTASAYDAAGQLISVTDPAGRVTAYAYDHAGRMVAATDPSGAMTAYAYDPAGNQVSSTDPTGRADSFAYDALSRLIASTDPAGAQTAYAYDAAGQLTATTDPAGRVTAYSYTPDGLLAGQTDAAGSTVSYAYDPAGQVTGITDPLGGTVSFSYTPSGLLAVEMDQNGNTTAYEYSAAGVLRSATDPLGIVTGYSRDAAGRLTAVTGNRVPGAAPGADVNVTTGYSYDAAGQLSAVTDPLGHVTGYARDPIGRITGVTDAAGNTAGYTYDPAGQVVSATDADGRTTSYGYTPTGLVSSIAPAAGQGAPSSYGYDAAGRLLTMNDGTGTSTWSYDAAGRVAAATDGAGATLAYGYDPSGIRTSLTYPDGTRVSYGLDAAGRIASQADPVGVVGYGYDAAGNLLSIERPNGAASTYSYDPTGQVASIAHTGMTAGDDAPEAPVPPDPSAGPGCGNGGVTPGCPQAALTAADGLPMTLTYTRDADGRVTGMRQQSASKDLTTAYAYDRLGRLTSSSRTDGAAAAYVYDAAGNLVSGTETDRITAQLLEYASTYSVTGQLLTKSQIPHGAAPTKKSDTAPGTVATANSYDKSGNLISQSVATTAAASGNSGKTDTATVSAANAYDYAGRLLTSTLSDGRTTSYTYDGLDRTASATLPALPTAEPGNNGNGNGNGNGGVSGETGGPGCGNGGTTPGCPAIDPATPYAGQAVHIVNDGATPVSWSWATGSIDLMTGPQGPDHQITAVGGAQSAAWFHLDQQGSPRALSDAAGLTVAAGSWMDYGAPEPASGTVWNGPNPGNGSPAQTQSLHAGPILPKPTAVAPIGYTAQQPNPSGSPDPAGQLHFPARDYQPGAAAWLQPDPLGGPGGAGLYTYVLGNPINLIDPDGRAPKTPTPTPSPSPAPGPTTPGPAPSPDSRSPLSVALKQAPFIGPVLPPTPPPAPPGGDTSGSTQPTDASNPTQHSQQYAGGGQEMWDANQLMRDTYNILGRQWDTNPNIPANWRDDPVLWTQFMTTLSIRVSAQQTTFSQAVQNGWDNKAQIAAAVASVAGIVATILCIPSAGTGCVVATGIMLGGKVVANGDDWGQSAQDVLFVVGALGLAKTGEWALNADLAGLTLTATQLNLTKAYFDLAMSVPSILYSYGKCMAERSINC